MPSSWSAAATPIWAMVCGFPSPLRERRKLVIVNGYIDDSADETVFVLAGYVAPAEEWAKFSDAWQAALDAEPRIAFLKTTDAMATTPRGQFAGWKRDAITAKLELLYSVIDAHASYEVSSVVVLSDLNKVFGTAALPKKARDPFFHAISSLISGVARLQIQQGVSADEAVEWVFDEDVMRQGRFIAIWEMLRATAPADVKPMLGRGTPAFRKDHDPDAPERSVLALQAADLEAWWLRRRWKERLQGLERLEYPWQPSNMPGATAVLDEPALIKIRDDTLSAFAKIGYDHATGKVDAAAQAALGLDED